VEKKVCKTELELEKLDKSIEARKGQKGALMPLLHESQKIFGFIPLAVQKKISEALKIPLAEVYGVVTFYNNFSLEPKGDFIVGVCMGTACYVKNAGKVLEDFAKLIGISAGETSEDGKWTLEATRCIGACGLAPVITVNEDVYGRLTTEAAETKEIFEKY